jgi:hypothetical protein
VNLPILRAGVPEEEKYHWGSVAALNSTYFANFGAELAVVSMLPMFFGRTFAGLRGGDGSYIMTATMAGLIAASFAFVNLVARPLGGLLSDTMKNRKRTMLIYMAGIAFGFVAMANIGRYGPATERGEVTVVPMFDGIWWLGVAVTITIACSMFVQGAGHLLLDHRDDGKGGTFAFQDLGCTTCHTVRGVESLRPPRLEKSFELGPSLAGLSRGGIATQIVAPRHVNVEAADLWTDWEPGQRVWLGPGQPVDEGEEAQLRSASRMRDYGTVLTVGQLSDLVAFLRSVAETE